MGVKNGIRFRDACARYLRKHEEANIEDMCMNLEKSDGDRFTQLPDMKAAHQLLNRDVRFEKVSMNALAGSRTSVYRLRKKRRGDE
jgi:hypothetical protein